MSTTSTVPAVIDGLLTDLRAGGLEAFESWPGAEAAREMVVLGEIEWQEYEIPTIKAGRKQRQEAWTVGFELYVMGQPGSKPSDASPSRDRAFALLKVAEDLLAVDVTGGTDFATVQNVQIRPQSAGPRVFENGWAYRIAGVFATQARLR